MFKGFPIRKPKAKAETFGRMAKRMATQMPFVRIDFLKENSLIPTVREYLAAAYAQNIPALPMAHMTEAFYYEAQQMIYEDRRRNGRRLLSAPPNVEELLCDVAYDDISSVTRLNCKVTFLCEGNLIQEDRKLVFSEHIRGIYRFIRDERMGWLLSAEEELRAVQTAQKESS